MLGLPCRHFAYPYGLFDEDARLAVEEAGYRSACSVRSGFNGPGVDRFLLRRIEVFGTDTLWRFRQKLRFGANEVSRLLSDPLLRGPDLGAPGLLKAIVDFTVIVCTYNRSGNLPSCLAALAGQEGAEGIDWEVLVVDNNSTRRHASRWWRSSVASCRSAFATSGKPEQGLNYARNRGVSSSTRHAFHVRRRRHPGEPAVARRARTRRSAGTTRTRSAAGFTSIRRSSCRPGSCPGSEIAGFLGYQDFGDEPFRMDGRSRYPFGGNMSFHRRVVDRIGLFDPKLGRKGEGRKRGELFKGAETDYFHRLAATGDARIFYEPRAIVYHRVQPHQLRQRYFLTIHFNAGYQRAFYDGKSYAAGCSGFRFFCTRS